MKWLRRLFGWVTLVSLVFWAAAAVYLVEAQYKDVPPKDWPYSYDECVIRWSRPVADAAKAEQIRLRCGDYYALLGDRHAPVLARLRQQTQGRIAEQVVHVYLHETGGPKPGDVVTGASVLAAVGSERLLGILYQAVRDASLPPSTQRRVTERCRLEETMRADRAYHADFIWQICAQP